MKVTKTADIKFEDFQYFCNNGEEVGRRIVNIGVKLYGEKKLNNEEFKFFKKIILITVVMMTDPICRFVFKEMLRNILNALVEGLLGDNSKELNSLRTAIIQIIPLIKVAKNKKDLHNALIVCGNIAFGTEKISITNSK